MMLALSEAGPVIALTGKDGAAATDLTEQNILLGIRKLADLMRAGVKRLLADGGGELFTEADRLELANAMAAAFGTAELLGRARIREKWAKVLRKRGLIQDLVAESKSADSALLTEDVEPLPPERAVRYFASLVPTLGIDPQRHGEDLRRRAFTLAVATERQLLADVQAVIRQRLETGQGISTAPRDIAEILDEAGVSPRNPQYAEMVFRTNTMDAYNQGADDERRKPDVQETFPVWQYSNPTDSRSRPHHAEKDGNYYPASASFVSVRGAGIEDAANCRCTEIPIDKWTWAELKSGGARIAQGFADVPMEPGPEREVTVTRPEPPKPEPEQPKPAPFRPSVPVPITPAATSAQALGISDKDAHILSRVEGRGLRGDYRQGNKDLPDQTREYLKSQRSATAVEHFSMSEYHWINKALWKGEPMRPGHQAVHDALQQAMAQTPPLAEPVTVYRGPSLLPGDVKGIIKQIEELKARGEPYEHLGYASTSTGAIVKDTSSAQGYDRRLQFVIQARHGVDVTPVADDDHKREREFLLPPGRFTIDSIEQRGGRTIVHMTQIVEAPKPTPAKAPEPVRAEPIEPILTTTVSPEAALRQLTDRFRELNEDELEAGVRQVFASLSKSEALELAAKFGVTAEKSKSGAVDKMVFNFLERRGIFYRTNEDLISQAKKREGAGLERPKPRKEKPRIPLPSEVVPAPAAAPIAEPVPDELQPAYAQLLKVHRDFAVLSNEQADADVRAAFEGLSKSEALLLARKFDVAAVDSKKAAIEQLIQNIRLRKGAKFRTGV